MIHSVFTSMLLKELPNSSNADRERWAKKIVAESIPIDILLALLHEEEKVATRAFWLFSQVAMENSGYLKPFLPEIYSVYNSIDLPGSETSVVNQWFICGIPESMESICMNRCFEWLASHETSITTKSRAIKVLVQLQQKYPSIKPEICSHLDTLHGKHTPSLDKLIEKSKTALL